MIKFLTISFFYSLILFSVMSANAQSNGCNITLEGRVIDGDTRLPIVGVNIKLSPGRHSVVSDGHGYYRFTALCVNEYSIEASSLGFDTFSAKKHIHENSTFNISLEHAHIHIHDVTIIGHQSPVSTMKTQQSLSSEQLAETRGQTLGEALSNLPGVSTLQTGNTISKPVINGLHSNRILILNNGVRQEGQQWGTDHAPEIDAFIAKNLTVIKGADGVQYGPDALGGVIIVSPEAMPIDPHLTGQVHLIGNTNGRAGIVSGTLGSAVASIPGLSWRAQGTLRNSGNLNSADYYLDNTGAREQHFSGSLQYAQQTTEIQAFYSRFSTALGILGSAHASTIEDIQARIKAGRPFEEHKFTYDILAPRQVVVHDLAKLQIHKDLKRGNQFNLQYSFQRNHRQEYDQRRGDRDALPMLDMNLYTQNLDGVFHLATKNGHELKTGVNGVIQVNNNVPGTQNTPLIPNFASYGGGLFLIDQYRKERFELEAGLRYDIKSFRASGYNQALELYGGERVFHNISGTLGAVWSFANNLQLRSNVGLAWRAPTANELYSNGLHHGAAVYEVGDPLLSSEQGYKWVTTLSQKTPNLSWGIDVYSQYIRNYIYSMPVVDEFWQSIRGTFPVFRYEQTNATYHGTDVYLNYQTQMALSYQVSASIIRAKDVMNNVYLPNIPADRINQQLRWALPVRHKSLQNSYLKATHSWVARQTRYEPNSDFAPPPPSYHVWGLHAGSTISVHEKELQLTISSTNIFNASYKDYMNRFRYYAHDLGRNISFKLAYLF